MHIPIRETPQRFDCKPVVLDADGVVALYQPKSFTIVHADRALTHDEWATMFSYIEVFMHDGGQICNPVTAYDLWLLCRYAQNSRCDSTLTMSLDVGFNMFPPDVPVLVKLAEVSSELTFAVWTLVDCE